MKSLFQTTLTVALLCTGMGGAAAAPAPWYWWISRHNGHRICAQTMPEQGWQKAEGPFNNARCQRTGTARTLTVAPR